MKIPDPNNEENEIEVYTADEVAQREADARAAVEGEFKPKVDELTGKLTEAEKRAAQRSSEFAHFRKLSDEQVAKLEEKDRIIYENQLTIQTEREKSAQVETERHNAQVDASIRAKVGGDEKAFAKMKEMWPLIGLSETTPEQIEQKVLAVLGAVGTTQPDALAALGGLSGAHTVPGPKTDTSSFGESDRGKAFAKELGLNI